jgi:16S rRNA processing protein RimM
MPLTDVPNRLSLGAGVLVEGETAPRRITRVGTSSRGPVLRLEGITDRDSAAALIGRHLSSTDPSPELPPDTYWWHQLEGLEVADAAGHLFGRLEEVFRVGENEVYRVIGQEGELLVPALASVVTAIDLETGRMTILDPAQWLDEV